MLIGGICTALFDVHDDIVAGIELEQILKLKFETLPFSFRARLSVGVGLFPTTKRFRVVIKLGMMASWAMAPEIHSGECVHAVCLQ